MEPFSALLALCAGNFTVHRWIPRTKATIDAELWCFLWSAPRIIGWVNNREAGDLRRHRAHYDVIAMNTRASHRHFLCPPWKILRMHYNADEDMDHVPNFMFNAIEIFRLKLFCSTEILDFQFIIWLNLLCQMKIITLVTCIHGHAFCILLCWIQIMTFILSITTAWMNMACIWTINSVRWSDAYMRQ